MNNNLGQVELIKDINPGSRYSYYYGTSYPLGSSLRELTEFKDLLYFSADNGETGRELWISDGTADGTQLVKDIAPGADNYFIKSSNPSEFVEFNDKLYFSADEGFWTTDGTAEGTQLVANIDITSNTSGYTAGPVQIDYYIEFNDKLYFSANDGETGPELWVSDGTAGGTQLLIDIKEGEDGFRGEYFVAGSSLDEFTEFNNKLYFSADNGTNGQELWVSDGTAEGTQLLIDIDPNNNNSSISYPGSPHPSSLTVLNDKLYFAADDGVNGRELWVSDGTAEGTQLLADINNNPRAYGGEYGSAPRELIEFNDKLYFSADDGVNGRELWISDGTAEGTKLLADIAPGVDENYGRPAESEPKDFYEFNDRLLFSANDGETGRELWVTDGTTEGTRLLADLHSLESDYPDGPREYTEFNDKLYFTAINDENGISLWATDGTTEGTQLVADLIPDTPNIPYRDYAYLTVVGNELFFSADNGETGQELFKLTVDDINGEMPIAVDGSDGDDNLFGGENAEQINGFGGRDRIDGGGGDDTIDGGEGDDRLISNSGNNSLLGGNGNDQLNGGAGNDTLDGGEGSDRLNGLAGDDSLLGGDGNDSLSGGENNDTLDGGDGDDILLGDNGNDLLMGDSGNDRLRGGHGNDTLNGGLGHDSLEGGTGHDVFVLRSGDGTDTIADFELGGDRLGLANSLQFDHLSFLGDKILAGEEVLANLNGIDTQHLTAHDFTEVD